MFKYPSQETKVVASAEEGIGEGVLVQAAMQTKSSHRGRLDIIAHILTSAVGGVRKTTIMYRCNLSFRQLEAYLGLLLSKELLKMLTRRESSASRYFETTERGLRFLKAYRSLNSLMKA